MSQQLIQESLSHLSLSQERMATRQIDSESLWHASLNLRFSNLREKTVLRINKHKGPLRVQRPFYPEDYGRCHCYILHPPAGVAGGDRLSIDIVADASTRVLITSPGAGKFYRCENKIGSLENKISVGKNASLDWLPQETLFFNGTRANVTTEIDMQSDARFVAWDIACLGRPASREVFDTGFIRQTLKITSNGVPQFIERTRIDNRDPILSGCWGWNHHTVSALLIANGITEDEYSSFQEFNQHNDDYMIGVTWKKNMLIARYLGDSAEQAKAKLQKILEKIREQRDEEQFVTPRIWHT